MKFTSRDWQITFLTGYMLIGSQSNELPKIDCLFCLFTAKEIPEYEEGIFYKHPIYVQA
jgi:hypothetical protein